MEAQQLAGRDELSSWSTVAYNEIMGLLVELNQQLVEQGLPQVDETVYSRRIGQALPPLIRQRKKGKNVEIGSSDGREQAETDDIETVSGSERSTSDCISLPPIRGQPGLAQYLSPSRAANDQDGSTRV